MRLPAFAWAILAIAVIASATEAYLLIPIFLPVSHTSNLPVVISIPEGSSIYPPGFNVTQLLTNTYHYRFNFTVTIGVNNTVQWVNNDRVAHTVSSFIVPDNAPTFNSGLIQPGKTFQVTLTIPGIYKYTCIWHPWLAGEITVKPA